MTKRSMDTKVRCLGYGILTALLTLFSLAAHAGPDLTPSVNYFNFDYGSVPMSAQVDSIVAGRYEALVADGSYGSGYVSKYNELRALDPILEFYVYHNFNDPYYSSAGLPPVNQVIGPLMEADGHDSTAMYWHSLDQTTTSFGSYSAYSVSEFNSRLLTYNGTRALVNNTDMSFIHHFVDYASQIASRHSGRNYQIAGLWFDNMSIPQELGVGTSTPGRHIYEAKLGGPTNQYGAWTISAWQQAYKDTVLIKYMAILGDSLKNRLNLKVCINALAWGYGDDESYACGYQPDYFMPNLVKPVNREFEFGLSPHDHNQQLLYPGPTNSATSINTATVAADYSPATIYSGQRASSIEGVENWFNPGHGYLEYPFRIYWYDCLAMYYLIRAKTTYISFANVPETRLGVLNWLDGGGSDGKCVPAGQPGDSCYWIGALGARVGRNGMDNSWDNDVVDWYVASVDCPECIITAGKGKDTRSQNWVVFRRRWVGDDGNQYMVLLRPAGTQQTQWAGSNSPTFDLLDGPWQKLDPDGNWGSPISTESLENGRGGIYRTAAEDCSTPPGTPGLSSPANGSGVAANRPTLCVTNSTPAPGCSQAQTYQFEIYSDAGLTTRVVGPSSVNEGSGTTCFTPPSDLSSGRWYWWRARGYNGTAYSPWAGPFNFYTPNTVPPVPAPIAPANGGVVDTTCPTLSAGSVTDADGTAVTYEFQVSSYSNFSVLVSSTTGLAQPTWTVPTALSNGTYYWRVRAADGIGYSSYSTTWSFQVNVSSNTPPSLSTLMDPVDGDSTTDLTPTLSVGNASDPDGDVLTYFFELYDFTGNVLLYSASNVAEGVTNTSWTVPSSLQAGTSYRWRVRCYDGTAYSLWSSKVLFTVITSNNCSTPPGLPGLSSPANGSGIVSNQATLCVTNSTPAPGCSELQTYAFEVYDDTALSSLVVGPMSVAEGSGTTCAVTSALNSGRWYLWRAGCYNGTSYSSWAGPFAFHTPNLTPPPPAPASPPQGSQVSSAHPTLRVQAATDADGTPVVYQFEVSTSSAFTSLTGNSGMILDTFWQVTPTLSNGTYYWRTRTSDGIDTSAYSTVRNFIVSVGQNHAPSTPTLYLPANGETIIDTPIVLIANNATDADGDPIYYDFYVYSNVELTQLVEEEINIPQQSGRTSADFFTTQAPVNNHLYYWYVLAHDMSAWSAPSLTRWFRYFSLSTGADSYQTTIIAPPSGATIPTRRPTLTARNIAGGQYSYYFDVATDESFATPTASSPAVPQGPDSTTSWTLTTALASGQTYYWRVKADDYPYSDVASFSIEAEVFVSPNPVRFEQGEQLTFHLPPEPVDILIQTVAGETVIVKQGVSNEWQWDGLNEAGHRVAPGVYLWYLRDTDDHGKIVVTP